MTNLVNSCAINFRAPAGTTFKANSVVSRPSGTGWTDRMSPTRDTSDLTVRTSISVKFTCKLTATNSKLFTGTDHLYSVHGKKIATGWTASAWCVSSFGTVVLPAGWASVPSRVESMARDSVVLALGVPAHAGL